MPAKPPVKEISKTPTCALIPARFASKRLPGKPLVPLGSMSLVERTYRNAMSMKLFDEVFVLTDDERVQKHVQNFDGKVLMTPSSCSSGTHRCAQALQQYEQLIKSPLIVNLQGDEPFIPKAAVSALLKMMQRYPMANIATCATPLKEEDFAKNSVVKCVFNLAGDALYFSRAGIPARKADAPSKVVKRMFRYRHIGIYAYRRQFLPIYSQLADTPLQILEDLEQLKVLEHGFGIKVACCEADCPLGVDTESELELARQWIDQRDQVH